MPIKNIKGFIFGRWTVLSMSNSRSANGNIRWVCKCECGNIKTVSGLSLRNGSSKSCGCFNVDLHKLQNRTHGHTSNKTSAEYSAWSHMKQRCYNPNCKQYPDYGARGITICVRWLNSFESFLEDMGKRPSIKHSLERKNNNGNYEPSNCKWATRGIQNRNKRSNRWLQYKNTKMVISDWAKKWGINYQEIQSFLKNGRSFEEIYNRYELGHPFTAIKKIDIVTINSKKIQVVKDGEVHKEYLTIAQAVRGEHTSKSTIQNHINMVKYVSQGKGEKLRKVPFDYSNMDKYFRLKAV